VISLKQFSGEFPRVAAHLLPDTAATAATDCDFTANVLTGINDFANPIATGLSGIRSVFAYANSDSGDLATHMYAWQDDADIVRGPVANDAFDRMYWTAAPDYRLMVTRDAMAGNGAAPDPAKTYWVGCPAPVLAPTVETNAFTYGGARLTDIVAVCETPTGTILSSESILSISAVTNDTASGVVVKASYAATCKMYSESAASLSGALPSGFVPEGMQPLYTRIVESYATDDFGAAVLVRSAEGLTLSMPKYTYSGKTYFHWQDWVHAPLGATIYDVEPWTTRTFGDKAVWKDPMSVKSSTPMTHIGSGWYCSDPLAQPPAGPTNTGSTLALRLYFGQDYVTLRETADRSSIPTAGYVGYFLYQNGIIEAYIRAIGGSTLIEERLYGATYVNIFGEESAMSPLAEVAVKEGYQAKVTAAGLLATPYAPIAKIRIYRSATGSNSTEMLFAAELDNASSVEFADAMTAASLGEPFSTVGFLPPEEGLRGLVALPNGILCAFKNNEVHFCQPYLPYAWRIEDIMTTSDTVVGSCAAEGGLYLTTRTNPYFISGITPDAMSQIKMTSIQAGVSKGSICNIGPVVAWASNDGIVTASGGVASLDFSFRFFMRNDWRKRYGDRLHLMRFNTHDGHLVCWFEDGTPGFLLRYDEAEPSMTKLSRGVYAACVHPKSDELYLCLNSSDIYAFKHYNAARKKFSWASKDFIIARPTCFGVVQAVGSGEVTIDITADGVLRSSKTVALSDTGMQVYRLPGGFLARKWSVLVTGTGLVSELNIAVSPAEFVNV
jgi:hypothetical protein